MKKLWEVLKPIVYGYTFLYLLVFLVLFIYSIFNNSLDIENIYKCMITSILVGIIPIILISFFKYYKKEGKINICKLLLMIPLGIGISLFYNMLTINLLTNKDVKEIPLIIIILYTGILGPIFEELLFRYFSLNKAKKIYGKKMGIIYVTIFFAFMHSGLISITYAFIIGLVLGYVYLKNKNIIYPISVHISANITSIFLKSFNIYLLIISIFFLTISGYFLERDSF